MRVLIPLTRTSHQVSTAAAYPGISTTLRSLGLLDVLKRGPARDMRGAPPPRCKQSADSHPGMCKYLKSGGTKMKLPGNLQQIMQQAQKMQEVMQQEIEKIKVDTSVGGGAVTIQMDGRKNLLDLKIDPDATGDVEMLRDLILSAFREATGKVDEEIKNKLGNQMGGLGLPPGLL
jgi:nucleoid-associated protein EbfC